MTHKLVLIKSKNAEMESQSRHKIKWQSKQTIQKAQKDFL